MQNPTKDQEWNFSEDSKLSFYQLVQNRKSIRKYKNNPVPKDLIEKILHAGIQAPSGKNRQNWKFIILIGKNRNEYLQLSQKSWTSIKDILKEKLKPSLYEFTERFFYTLGDAPVLIFCYSTQTNSEALQTNLDFNQAKSEENYLTSVGSVYMAIQNILLAATVEGLGTCVMGAPLEIKSEVNEFLNSKGAPIEKSDELLCCITLGFPDHNPPKAKRTLENKVTWI